jgi:hypothetical protein
MEHQLPLALGVTRLPSVLCLVAMRTDIRRFHTGLVAFTLIYQVSSIVWFFDTIV